MSEALLEEHAHMHKQSIKEFGTIIRTTKQVKQMMPRSSTNVITMLAEKKAILRDKYNEKLTELVGDSKRNLQRVGGGYRLS